MLLLVPINIVLTTPYKVSWVGASRYIEPRVYQERKHPGINGANRYNGTGYIERVKKSL